MQLSTFALAAGLSALSVGSAAQVPQGKPGPAFLLKTVSGQRLGLSSLRGKVVLLDFWGPS